EKEKGNNNPGNFANKAEQPIWKCPTTRPWKQFILSEEEPEFYCATASDEVQEDVSIRRCIRFGICYCQDQLMDGYPSDEDREAIFQAYVKALNEDPQLTVKIDMECRDDAQKPETWALKIFMVLNKISTGQGGDFTLEAKKTNLITCFLGFQLCASLNINRKSVDRDLDVYRNLLSKLVQAKELLKEYVELT
ncbi:hypothetical protein M8C21_011497, partial [Ambrosia artemisiifolia]